MSEDERRVIIHDRVFQQTSIDENIYLAPVAGDDREEDRLTDQHNIVCALFGGALFSPRIPIKEPSSILECGYGGGDWAVQCAEEFEDCQVTALDIFPTRVTDQPDNLDLVGYNLNDKLRDLEVFRSRPYNLIHSRFVCQGIKSERWASYIRDMRLLLRPGGWVQIMEYYPIIQSDNGRLTDQSAVRRWWLSYKSAMARLNRDPKIGLRLQQLLMANEYRDVMVEVEQLPIGGWHPDATKASIGRDSVAMVGDLLESLGLWPFTSKLGWTAAQFDYLMWEVRAELQTLELKLYINM
ncbi:hypothetical protein EJ02DRAFT_418224 [Clathrospora elynae]|uniref:S-adenosyl-L-methionine-dependent methyltransferase n=1 Tax=Clathrospora elynae TaxID=706981 RepID=A0A6A5T583_9PLEO|nr:hypothetical protein EJ02DRAFT_418224 [Clathrospora elynae]